MQATSLSHCAVIGDASDPLTAREHAETPHAYRSAFQRDRDRVIHARAFRRLAGKTQVFTHRNSDHFRSRLTHTIEVTQIARTAAAALNLNEELVETLALVHDIGHPPFGHAGEQALDRQLQAYGLHFDHNLHALRIVEYFEQRYAGFRGLNLTLAVREGIIKHSREYSAAEFPQLAEYLLDQRPPLESQLIDFVDEIAYNTADLDDGFEARLIDLDQLRAEVPIFNSAYEDVDRHYREAKPKLKFNESLKRVLDLLATDLIETTQTRAAESGVATVEDIRRHPQRLAGFSPAVAKLNGDLKRFLFARLYSQPTIVEDRDRSVVALDALFSFFLDDPKRMPLQYAKLAAQHPPYRVICDYIAGMTDHFLLRQCHELLGLPAAP